ncbi:MAG: DNA-processing protein DprA [Candidatus Cloacimonetes bacterium]|nr:DNA-processing protein DprA [Candidatus Cloacimonadota bacterium]
MTAKIKSWIRLVQIKDLGLIKTHQMLKALGEPENFIGKGLEPLEPLDFVSHPIKKQIAADKDPENWSQICKLIERYKINFVTILDKDFPEPLINIFNPPLFLFYRGNLPILGEERALAVVGTRKPDNYGIIMTRKITEQLVAAGFTIVSGLAYGVDTQAHLTTVESKGRTIAVMGTGCDQIYPQKNHKLAERILEKGALISEFLPGSKPEKWNFPLRNRIISGLTVGTFVVQGEKTSGALLTAKFALDQNRDLFALPGDINRKVSEGPNYLIKLGAKIVTSHTDIIEEYDLLLQAIETAKPELNKNEEMVLKIIRENRPAINYDNLVLKTGLSIGQLSAILLNLEIKNLVRVGDGTMVSSVD